jgi:6-phosphogluconolactonase
MKVVSLPDPAGVADEAARHVVALATEAISARGRFSVALSGGSTPRPLHARLASAHHDAVEGPRVLFFWRDARAVPPDHPDSNYRMARETLLEPLAIDASHVHRMRGEDPDPTNAADEYARMLAGTFPGPVPTFDLVLLGMGADGHTASLFPNTPALSVEDRTVVANLAPKPPVNRITLTFPVLLAARAVRVLVTGADKASTLEAVLHGPPDPHRLPAQRLASARGDVRWLVVAATQRT